MLKTRKEGDTWKALLGPGVVDFINQKMVGGFWGGETKLRPGPKGVWDTTQVGIKKKRKMKKKQKSFQDYWRSFIKMF